jgi:hypothetical protein
MAGPTPREYRFVIDDPEKVDVIQDHGERQYRAIFTAKDNGRDPKPNSTVETPENVKKNTAAQLVDALQMCFLEGHAEFVPRSKFDQIVTIDVVFRIVCTFPRFQHEDANRDARMEFAKAIFHGDKSHGPCRKLLCVLLQMPVDLEAELLALREDGLCDDCLPLIKEKGNYDPRFPLHCRLHTGAQAHKIINPPSRARWYREQFSNWSRKLTPVFITWEPNSKHKHYVLQEDDPLPMVHDYGGKKGGSESLGDEGGFSEVIRVKTVDSSGAVLRCSNHNVRFHLTAWKRITNIYQ